MQQNLDGNGYQPLGRVQVLGAPPASTAVTTAPSRLNQLGHQLYSQCVQHFIDCGKAGVSGFRQ
jgi:hypothetical protein